MSGFNPQSAQARLLLPDGTPEGCGVLVSDRHIISCDHVAQKARQVETGIVKVDFPIISKEVFDARIVRSCPANKDACQGEPEDIAVLELISDPRLPEGAVPAPVSNRRAHVRTGQKVGMYGAPEGMDREGDWVEGEIKGPSNRGYLQIDALPSKRSARKGFSGTAVWNETRQAAVGMLVGDIQSEVSPSAYMIPVPVLAKAWPDLLDQPDWRGHLKKPLILLVLALIAIVAAYLVYYPHPKPPPRFSIVNPYLTPDAPLVIRAENPAANQRALLSIEFRGLLFERKGIPQARDGDAPQTWHFSLRDCKPPEYLLTDGIYPLRIRFAGGPFYPRNTFNIAFDTSPLDLKVINYQEDEEAGSRTYKGKGRKKAVSEGYQVNVDITLYHDGKPFQSRVPVNQVKDPKTGVIYFEFEHSIEMSEHLTPDDPGYKEMFFELKVSDNSGRTLYQNAQTYERYIARGDEFFGVGDLGNIRIEKPDTAETPFQHGQRIIITPDPHRFYPDPGGEPPIRLVVTETVKNTRELKWKTRPGERAGTFIILRDGQELARTKSSTYTDDDELETGQAAYRVDQEMPDGTVRESNAVDFEAAPRVALTLRSNVFDDRVYIDDVAFGSTRLDVEIPAGKHQIRVEKPGYTTYEEEIDLRESTTIRAELTPAVSLSIVTIPEGATISLDGAEKGPAPVDLTGLKPEVVQVTAALEGYATAKTDVDLSITDLEPLRLELKPLPKGRLIVRAIPEDAEIRLVGSERPYKDAMELETGPHVVEISRPGFKTERRELDILEGETTAIEITLEAEDEVFTNSIGMRFVRIPAGSFQMGSPPDEPGRYDDEKQHKVTLTKGFYMQTTEVTQGQWERVMGKNPSNFTGCGANCPVESVSWEDAREFILKLNGMEGTNLYRLPTEAEWEYACRAGTATAIYTGQLEILGENNAPALDPIAWYGGNSGVDYDGGVDSSGWAEKQNDHTRAGTHPVGLKRPNALGLYDMLGNVNEWCSDYWSEEYPDGPVVNPTGPADGANRVIRGGSWSGLARRCRAAYRSYRPPGDRDGYVGLRLSRSLP